MPLIKRKRSFWLVTVAALVVAGLTFSLGQWQLRRGASKEAVQQAIESKKNLPVLNEKALGSSSNPTTEIYRTALLRGVWQEGRTVYLDNRPMRGRTGFWVMTPLLLEGSSRSIVVQRGWAPRDFNDRSKLPAVETPEGVVTVTGRIAPPPSKLYEFDTVQTGVLRQNLDLGAYKAETGLALLDVSLLQTGAPSQGMNREWAAPNTGVEKHVGYAVQWFALCALVVGLYGWFQFVAPWRTASRNSPSTAADRRP